MLHPCSSIELTKVSETGIEFVPNHTGVLGRVSRSYRKNISTPGIVVEGIPVPGVYIFWGRTELTEVSGTGIQFVPNLPMYRVLVLSSYRNIPECSVGN